MEYTSKIGLLSFCCINRAPWDEPFFTSSLPRAATIYHFTHSSLADRCLSLTSPHHAVGAFFLFSLLLNLLPLSHYLSTPVTLSLAAAFTAQRNTAPLSKCLEWPKDSSTKPVKADSRKAPAETPNSTYLRVSPSPPTTPLTPSPFHRFSSV